MTFGVRDYLKRSAIGRSVAAKVHAHGLSELSDTTLGGNLNVSTFHLHDAYGNEILKFAGVASAVNELTISNAVAGSSPAIAATGDDTNIDIILTPKGSGAVKTSADGPVTWAMSAYGGTWIRAILRFLAADGTQAAPQHLASGAVMGDIHFRGLKGTGSQAAALIRCVADATHSSSSTAGRLEFYTTAGSSPVLAMKIDKNQNAWLSGNVNVNGSLDVGGDVDAVGEVRGRALVADGTQAGQAGTITVTNQTISAAAMDAKMGITGTAGGRGVLVGTTMYWEPYWA